MVASGGLGLVSVFVGDGSPLDGGWQRLDLATDAQGPQIIRVGDLDGDGRADVLVADGLANSVRWWPNVGGQFALPTTDLVASARVAEGVADLALLRIDGLHRGRPGDAGAEISTLELLLEEAPGDPLTGSELDALINAVRLYRDDGDGDFDPGLDTAFFAIGPPFSLTDGVLTVTMVDGDSNVQLAVGSGKTFFLAADLAVDAGSATPNGFRVTHLISSSSTGEMATTDIPLRLEDSGDVTSTGIEILPSEIFADGFESGDTTLWSAVTP